MPDTKQLSLPLPLVTVVVTSYNHGPFLRQCLDSVLLQTYRRLQLIIVDNLSTDNSRDIIDIFLEETSSSDSDRERSKIFAKENNHLTGAIMESIASIKGSYVIFVDGDDYLLPACVETHIKAHLVSRIAVGVTSVDMYQCRDDEIVIATGRPVSEYVMSKRGQAKDFCRMANLDHFCFGESDSGFCASDLHFVEPSIANEWVWSPTSGLCFRREAVELLLSSRPNLLGGTDNYLVRGISALTGGITIDRALAVYRMHGSNMFSKHLSLANFNMFDRSQYELLDDEVMKEILECYKMQIPHLAKMLTDRALYFSAINTISKISPKAQGKTKLSSYTLHYILENQNLLKQNFGATLYRQAYRRYLKLTDIVRLLKWRGRVPKL